MRLPSGEIAAPWLTSIPSITPTTLLVAGSMTWTLSPALLVWMIRTLFCADRATESKTIAPNTVTERHIACWIVIASTPPTKNPGFQGLPFRIVLRSPVLVAVVKEIATRAFRERMHEQAALREAAGH